MYKMRTQDLTTTQRITRLKQSIKELNKLGYKQLLSKYIEQLKDVERRQAKESDELKAIYALIQV